MMTSYSIVGIAVMGVGTSGVARAVGVFVIILVTSKRMLLFTTSMVAACTRAL